MNTNIEKDHYIEDYDTKKRWISYYHQIDFVLENVPGDEKLLEIGVGNKTVYDRLEKHGYDITGFDHNEDLDPDIQGDIRNLPFEEDEFHSILCCEVLEHLPFSDVEEILEAFSEVAEEKVIISVPHKANFVKLNVSMFSRIYFSKNLMIPLPFLNRKHEFDGQHYWELGSRQVPEKKFKEVLRQNFEILEDFRVPEHPYHHFFVLEVKD